MSYNLQCVGSPRRSTSGDVLATIALMDENGVERFTDKVNLTSSRQRQLFAKELLKRFPDLKSHDVESKLLELLWKIPAEDKESGEDHVPQAQVLVNLVRKAGHQFFRDGQTPFVAIERDGHREVWPVHSQGYKRWLSQAYFKAEDGKVPNLDAVGAALNTLEGFAVFDGEDHRLGNRVTWHKNELWYDLTDDAWRAIRIGVKDWEIVDRPPILFQRWAHQLPQITPVKGGDPRAILRFLRPTDEQEELLWLAYIGACLIPDIPHPIPIVYGDPGAGKSMRLRLVRQLLDPSRLPLLSVPRDQQALNQILSHHWVAFFDNVTFLPDWFSDALCRASTGEGSSKRQLFTDDDDVLYSFRRCVGLNGINIMADKSDLLDRSLLVHYRRITDEELLEEKKLLDVFQAEMPAILGGFLDTMVKAISIKPTVHLPWRSRMVDFVAWGAAIARALGCSEMQFLQAYSANIQTQNQTALAASLVATVILEFMAGKDNWTGTPAALLAALEPIADNLKINTRERGWPKTPNWLTRRVNEVRVNLLAEGISVTEEKKDKNTLTLRRVRENTVFTDEGSEIGTAPDSDSKSEAYRRLTVGLPSVETSPDSKLSVSTENTVVFEPESADGIDGIFDINSGSRLVESGAQARILAPIPDFLPPEYPTTPCHICGSSDYWLTRCNQWLCARCHPKPEEEISARVLRFLCEGEGEDIEQRTERLRHALFMLTDREDEYALAGQAEGRK
jgi:hypothetical protein